MRLAYIPRIQIEIGERGRKKYDNLEGITADIDKRGMICPIAVVESRVYNKIETDKPYILLAGGRRLRAAEKLGMNSVPAHIYDHILSEQEMRAIELSENIHRDDLAWDEKIAMEMEIHKLMVSIHGEKVAPTPDAPGWSQADTAHLLNISESTLSRDIKLAITVEAIPELKGVADKTTARKMAESAGRTIIRSEKAKKLEASHIIGDEALKKKKLTDSYLLYPVREKNILISGFFEGIKKIEDNYVDIIELDPPYAIALNLARKTADGDKKTAFTGYNEIDPKVYIEFITKMLEQCYRVLKPGGWIITWFGPDPWFSDIASDLSATGFKGMAIPGIWAKGMGQTNRPDLYLGSTYEMFFYYRKGEAVINKPGRGNIFSFKSVSPSTKTHPTERPIEMIMEVLSTFCDAGSIIMVPCLGSGNTLLAAHNLGMSGFGFEVDSYYRDAYIIKVNKGTVGQYRSYKQGK